MALAYDPASSVGFANAVQGASALFADINKTKGPGSNGNPVAEDTYESDLPDEEIVSLIGQWTQTYNKYYEDGIRASQDQSYNYWIGKHATALIDSEKGSNNLTDNKIFEATETFIPIATRANPDPLVKADPDDLGEQLADDIKTALVYEADRVKLRKIMKGVIRDWMICRLGLIKVGYNEQTELTTIEKINPKRWKGDKDGHWDESCHFTGQWQSEDKLETAGNLISMFPDKQDKILEKAGGKKGTKLTYTEWWYKDTDVFYTLDELIVLGKYKNPHWNYDIPAQPPQMDQMGNPISQPQPPINGKNHFESPRAPYMGLSIFSTAIQPHDDTSIILQNISLQDSVNNLIRQIERNVKGMNNSMVLSDDFTAEQADLAAVAVLKGKPIRSPSKDPKSSVARIPPSPLPGDVYQSLNDRRNEIRNIFGTSASTPQGVENQPNVRGKILANQLDSSRIGGGITEYLEQLADAVYNWFVQIMFVHWTEPHYIVAAGQTEGTQLVQLVNTNLALLQTLDITVKDGTLIPKDPLSERNEAVDLWSAGAIDPKNFYKKLGYADPEGMAEQLVMWQMLQKGQIPPQAYLPTFGQNNPAMQQMQQMQQAQQQAQMNGPNASGNPPGPGGVGGPSVNPLGPQQPQQQPEAASPGADRSQSSQLIKSIPIH